MSGVSPIVSVGLPVFNGEVHLRATLDSLLAQDFELLISETASTDGTQAICRAYAARDARIRYTRLTENMGPAANYNGLVGMARGEFFRSTSHDDLCEPTHLSRCLAEFSARPGSTVLCYPKTIIIDGEFEQPDRRLRAVLRNLRLCNPVFGLMRLEALRKTKLIGNYENSDSILLGELSLLRQTVEVPEFLFFRRRDPRSHSLANLKAEDKITWYRPGAPSQYKTVRTSLALQHFWTISRAAIPWREKLRCHRTLISEWFPRYWRVVGGEFKIVLKRKLRMSP